MLVCIFWLSAVFYLRPLFHPSLALFSPLAVVILPLFSKGRRHLARSRSRQAQRQDRGRRGDSGSSEQRGRGEAGIRGPGKPVLREAKRRIRVQGKEKEGDKKGGREQTKEGRDWWHCMKMLAYTYEYKVYKADIGTRPREGRWSSCCMKCE